MSKIKLVLQTEATECGIACLAMISGYYGFKTNLSEMRSKFSFSTHGVNLQQLMDAALTINLSSRPLQLDLDEVPQLQTPCILHWDMNHFVVLKQAGTKYTILDPATGERRISKEEFSRHFTGIALELTPTEEFKKKDTAPKLKITQLWSKITGLKRSLFQIFALAVALKLFSLAMPLYMQTVIDDVIVRMDLDLLILLALGFGLLMIVNTATTAIRSLITLNMASKLTHQMAINVFCHLIRLPTKYFNSRHIGDIVSRFGSISKVNEIISNGIISSVMDSLMIVLTLIVMMLYSPILTAVAVGFSVVYVLLRIGTYKPFHQLNEEQVVSQAKENSNFMETVRAIQGVKIFMKERQRTQVWQEKFTDALNNEIRIGRWNIGFNSANGLVFGFENILIIYCAASIVISGGMTLGMMMAFMTFKRNFTESVDSLVSTAIEFGILRLHLDRLSDIVFEEKEQHPTKPIQNSGEQEILGLVAKGVSFRFSDSDPFILDDINLQIQPGESVVITGPSGCGKTTLLKCLMGQLTISSGEILVGEQLIDKVPNYRHQVAAVMQDDHLLSGSIMENIAFFESKIDHERVALCASMAAIHDDIMKLPMNYNTLIGDMGSSLSGGQKQRIMLARALYRQPKYLFLDEATSQLDAENEALVNNNMKQLNITRISIAHRQETIDSADRVIKI